MPGADDFETRVEQFKKMIDAVLVRSDDSLAVRLQLLPHLRFAAF